MTEKASATGKISMRKSQTVILLNQTVISGKCSAENTSKKAKKRKKKKLKDKHLKAEHKKYFNKYMYINVRQ